MESLCCLVLMQPVGVHGVPNTVSDSLGLSSFEELLLLSPHFHLAESFCFPIEWRSGCVTGFDLFGSQDTSHHEKTPEHWSWNQLKVLKDVSNGD